jgi:hypothetical protein
MQENMFYIGILYIRQARHTKRQTFLFQLQKPSMNSEQTTHSTFIHLPSLIQLGLFSLNSPHLVGLITQV